MNLAKPAVGRCGHAIAFAARPPVMSAPFLAGLRRLSPIVGHTCKGPGMLETMASEEQPRLYTDLTAWWPVFSPPSHYEEEAAACPADGF